MDEKIKPEGLMTVVTGNYEIKMTDAVSMETVRKIQAEHDAEVGELVEALEKIATQAGKMAHADNLYSDPRFSSFWSLVSICEPLLRRYTKTPCPECGGSKESIDVDSRTITICPTCKGSGKVWRKK